MGNAGGKLTPCFCNAGEVSGRHDIAVVLSDPLDEGIGHSFCYIRPDQFGFSSSSKLTDGGNQPTTFRTISGASISANPSTPLSTAVFDPYSSIAAIDRASSFESSSSFASVPLQPIPRNFINSGPLPRNSGSILGSAPIERRFLSGPIERAFISGPMDRNSGSIIFSGSLENRGDVQIRRIPSLERIGIESKYKFNKWGSILGLKRAILNLIWGLNKRFKELEWRSSEKKEGSVSKSSTNLSSQASFNDDNHGGDVHNCCAQAQNLQWAQGKAGEDRVHVVISEDYGWVFVGIYDGFNGPDAPDFLLSNLYAAVDRELKGLLGINDKLESNPISSNETTMSKDSNLSDEMECFRRINGTASSSSPYSFEHENSHSENGDFAMLKKNNSRNWNCEFDNQFLELDGKIREKHNEIRSNELLNLKHSDVLRALSEALRKTEAKYFDVADTLVMENPELSLMGSCVLAMVMIGEDIYLMNLGDSRAVIGQKTEPDLCIEKGWRDNRDIKSYENDPFDGFPYMTPLQLTVDHNTNVKEELQRIKNEHPDDPSAVVNDRVKGSLKVTRAFGVGFLKKPKWNETLLEMFQIDYIGNSPYIISSPSLYHHKLGQRDRFLILSSDGLYQYFTNEEAVNEVEMFMATTPEGDPAQHLIEEVLFRAAKKAGIDFHELLDIPQGERRRYHDDVSIIIISLEGQIWRSSV
ncbi:hypothetical protein Nepgr_024930 [Nepenthes gracilis]|uniref:PPM-type phosphatase domain-containing protein n=1 Tax=Nepenthes gracilis TaxID=150966 RepID=A0AAD3T6V3_NEPGR|nr:hypothetical protein Nepgr_024930 [Nepenthes gracilis]